MLDLFDIRRVTQVQNVLPVGHIGKLEAAAFIVHIDAAHNLTVIGIQEFNMRLTQRMIVTLGRYRPAQRVQAISCDGYIQTAHLIAFAYLGDLRVFFRNVSP